MCVEVALSSLGSINSNISLIVSHPNSSNTFS